MASGDATTGMRLFGWKAFLYEITVIAVGVLLAEIALSAMKRKGYA